MTRWLVSINPSETRGQQTRRPAAGRGIQFWHQCTMYINRYLECSYLIIMKCCVHNNFNSNEKRSLKPPVNERQEGVQEYWRTLMSKLEGMGAAAINLGWLGWSAAAGPVWLPSWMLLSTLQVTQASLTTKQPASAEKLAFVENRKIEVKWWHFGISQKSMILNHGLYLYTLYRVQQSIRMLEL